MQYCSAQNPKSNPCGKFAKCIPLNDGRDVRCEVSGDSGITENKLKNSENRERRNGGN